MGHAKPVSFILLTTQFCFTGCEAAVICAWAVRECLQRNSNLIYSLSDPSGSVVSLSYHEHAKILFCSDSTGGVTVWDANRCVVISRFQAHRGTCYGTLGDGVYVTGGEDRIIKIWGCWEKENRI